MLGKLFLFYFSVLNFLMLAVQAQNSVPQQGDIVRDRVGIEMVYVPSATFVMGVDSSRLLDLCEARDEPDAEQCVLDIQEDTGATLTYTVKIPAYWIDRYEVTIKEFNEHCMASFELLSEPCADSISKYRPELAESIEQPRVGISWERAMIFCAARGARLPTEVEWEYAASGPDKFLFPWGNEFKSEYVHSSDDSYTPTKTYPVGSVAENQSWIGVYDLSGNAAEWVDDRFISRFLITLTLDEVYISIRDYDADIRRTIRGGSYDGRLWTLMTFYHESEQQKIASEYIGFRCARHIYPGS